MCLCAYVHAYLKYHSIFNTHSPICICTKGIGDTHTHQERAVNKIGDAHTCTIHMHSPKHTYTSPKHCTPTHTTHTQHTPVFVVAMLWLCVVQDVLPGPAGGLFPTQQQAQLVRSEHAESLHWKHLVKAIYSTMWHTREGSHSYVHIVRTEILAGNLFGQVGSFESNLAIFHLPKLHSVMSSLLHNHGFHVYIRSAWYVTSGLTHNTYTHVCTYVCTLATLDTHACMHTQEQSVHKKTTPRLALHRRPLSPLNASNCFRKPVLREKSCTS